MYEGEIVTRNVTSGYFGYPRKYFSTTNLIHKHEQDQVEKEKNISKFEVCIVFK